MSGEPQSWAATAVDVFQQIRAGWLPHRLSDGSWWWGRPAADDGFRLWSVGMVPCMSVVRPMDQGEIVVWEGSLHPMAQERTP